MSGAANGDGPHAGPSAAAPYVTGLQLHDSVTGKRPFMPVSGGRAVSEYICGPTVYAAAHLGHARNYVTFDVIRRVMEDYFGYRIRFVMNITDVDDKTINRARQAHLLAAYKDAARDATQVLADAGRAAEAAVAKQAKKAAAAADALAAPASDRVLKARRALAAEEALKLSTATTAAAAVASLPASDAAACGFAAVWAAAGDALASWLDDTHGAGVTNSAVFRAHALFFEAQFFEDMATLGVRPPDAVTRVSEHMGTIVSYIAAIVARGLGYAASGSVYFDVRAFKASGHTYGKLVPSATESLAADLACEGEAGFADNADKRGPSDFALWKAAKPGEPVWESPWGPGRPGWHIECSAMCGAVHGPRLDIHGGGVDLKFPHHDNEIAQCEAHSGTQDWAGHFLHSGHLNIAGHKMSKSLKNFVTIREAFGEYRVTPRQLRLYFVLHPWGDTLNLSEAALEQAKLTERDLARFLAETATLERDVGTGTATEAAWGQPEVSLGESIAAAQEAVHASLCDSIDTGSAVDALIALIAKTNAYTADRGRTPGPTGRGLVRAPMVRKAADVVSGTLRLFGLEFGISASTAGGGGGGGDALVDAFVAFRDTVRTLAKALPPGERGPLLTACDGLRDSTFVDLGIRLEDRSDGGKATWRREDPAVMKLERDEAELRSIRAEITKARKEIDKWAAAASDPAQLHRGATDAAGDPKFGGFDARGVPSADGAGKPLKDSAVKALTKATDKATEAHRAYQEKLAAEPGFLDGLRTRVRELEADEAAINLRLASLDCPV